MHHLRKGLTRRAVHRSGKRIAGSIVRAEDDDNEDAGAAAGAAAGASEPVEQEGDTTEAESNERDSKEREATTKEADAEASTAALVDALSRMSSPPWALATDAVVRLLRAALPDCPLERSLFSFVVDVVMQLAARDICLLGDLSRQLGVYPVMAFFFLNGSTLEGECSSAAALRLAAWLDRALPTSAPRAGGKTEALQKEIERALEGMHGAPETAPSLWALGCAIPFAYGAALDIRPLELDAAETVSATRAMAAGDEKRVRYILNFASERSRSGDDSEESGSGSEASASGSEDEASEVQVLGLRPARIVWVRDRVTPRELMSMFRAVKAPNRIVGLLDMLRGRISGGRAGRGAKQVSTGNPYSPHVSGSLLRAYLREVHAEEVDRREPAARRIEDILSRA